jgi:hypothetical protein
MVFRFLFLNLLPARAFMDSLLHWTIAGAAIARLLLTKVCIYII